MSRRALGAAMGLIVVAITPAARPALAEGGHEMRHETTAAPPAQDTSSSMAAAPASVALQFPESGIVRVPFRRGARNHVLVDVRDGEGRALTFVLDTGASFSVRTPAYPAANEEPAETDAESPHAVGAHGTLPGAMKFSTLEHLHIGALTIEHAGAVAMAIPNLDEGLGAEIHGIIGFNVLSRMITMIDYAAGDVVFVDPSSDAEAVSFGEPDDVIPFELRMGALIEIEGRVEGGEPMPFVYDIGSPRTILNAVAAKASGIAFARLSPEEAKAISVMSQGLTIEKGKGALLEFGSLRFEKPVLYSIDLPVFATLGFGERGAGLLGNDLLGSFRVGIDYDAKELRVWSAEPTED